MLFGCREVQEYHLEEPERRVCLGASRVHGQRAIEQQPHLRNRGRRIVVAVEDPNRQAVRESDQRRDEPLVLFDRPAEIGFGLLVPRWRSAVPLLAPAEIEVVGLDVVRALDGRPLG